MVPVVTRSIADLPNFHAINFPKEDKIYKTELSNEAFRPVKEEKQHDNSFLEHGLERTPSNKHWSALVPVLGAIAFPVSKKIFTFFPC